MLEEIINEIKDVTGYPVYFNQTKKHEEDCIVYKDYIIQTNDGIEQHRLELTIIASDYATCLEKSKAINSFLVTPYDLWNNSLQCQINGGGVLVDDDNHKVHYVTYYYYTVRG